MSILLPGHCCLQDTLVSSESFSCFSTNTSLTHSWPLQLDISCSGVCVGERERDSFRSIFIRYSVQYLFSDFLTDVYKDLWKANRSILSLDDNKLNLM